MVLGRRIRMVESYLKKVIITLWIRDEHSGSYFRELINNYFGLIILILKSFMWIWIRDPKSFWPWIRDGNIRIRDKHPGSATMVMNNRVFLSFFRFYRTLSCRGEWRLGTLCINRIHWSASQKKKRTYRETRPCSKIILKALISTLSLYAALFSSSMSSL